MGKYIDRIIEVLDDNNVWQTVVLPTDGMGTTKESVIFGLTHLRFFGHKGWCQITF